ncbi:hypothetical protein BASA83_000074 [Batrachochytrium salamandrivorans]|nr:hypothetical protein BASA83_000074 [Batrachochytrium salamandrivorans]
MQFFYLFSFVVAASYAAALPQPAGLSEKYSNSADTTLASSLEARSYQPESNSQKGSATLTSLWQQDVFRGSSPPLPPLLTREDIQKIVNNVFKESDFSSANIASTIDKFGNGVYHLFDNGERARKKIGEFAGEALERYLSSLLWVMKQYYKIIKDFVNLSAALTAGSSRKEDNASKIILDIIERTDNDVFDDAREIGILFKEAFDNRITLFKMLKFLLKDAEVSKTLHENMSAMITSLGNFLADQKKTHDAIMKELKPPPFEWLP